MITARRAKAPAFTKIELLVCLFVIVLLAVVFGPQAVHWGRNFGQVSCVGQLMNIGLGMRTWGTDHQDKFPMQVSTNEGGVRELTGEAALIRSFAAISNCISTPLILICRDDRQHRAARTFTDLDARKNLSYFINFEVSETEPNALLAGDNNLESTETPTNGVLRLQATSRFWWTPERHGKRGFIAVGDGSVRNLPNPPDAARLQEIQWPARIMVPE